MTIRELQPILDTMEKKSEHLYMLGKFSIWINGNVVTFGNMNSTILTSLEKVTSVEIDKNMKVDLADSSITFWR